MCNSWRARIPGWTSGSRTPPGISQKHACSLVRNEGGERDVSLPLLQLGCFLRHPCRWSEGITVTSTHTRLHLQLVVMRSPLFRICCVGDLSWRPLLRLLMTAASSRNKTFTAERHPCELWALPPASAHLMPLNFTMFWQTSRWSVMSFANGSGSLRSAFCKHWRVPGRT